MKQKKRNAFILITTIIVSLILFAISVFFASIVKMDSLRVRDIGYNTISYYTAESGLEYIKAQMAQGKITSSAYSKTIQLQSYDAGITAEFTVNDSDGFDVYTTDNSIPDYPYVYTVESTATIKKGDEILAQKKLNGRINTNKPILGASGASAYISAVCEEYR